MRRPLLALLPLLALSAAAIRIVERPPAAPTALPSAPQPNTSQPSMPQPSMPQPSTPLYPAQWNLAAIRAPQAWAVSRGAPVTVALLDTGYAPLAGLGARAVNGYDFVSDPALAGDGDGRDADASDGGTTAYHASMLAGLLAGAWGGPGVAGLNPLARVVQVRVADVNGEIRARDVADALRWAAGLSVPGAPRNPFPARVINLSLFVDFIPLTGCDAGVQAAIDTVTARGAVVVAGAGNDDADAALYTPAGCRGVITVTATDRAGRRASYANWGGSVTLAAPGGSVDAGGTGAVQVSTPLGTSGRTGTSLAAPLVSGVVSLMLGLNPALTPAEVKRILQESAAPLPGCPAPKSCGAGLLDAGRALRAAKTFGRSTAPAASP